ncbi:uncharacterized protein LY89DRAFT_733887 [Mollisia scopiformis]|uniref:DUF6536 domain-containing protein n=1 Tax=Mollisia scopiformis TaxID=149040 RepID=A0A194X9S9_MOLSC|nr:uncharacterized protein LY89DRAFT_733887 [Mollisia scopiformis]KUJ16884.1 hypothetical protein LY89DRAFT_733887 [Mollisia scopiformis]
MPGSEWIQMQSPPQFSEHNPYASSSSLNKPAFGGKYTEVAVDENSTPPYRKQNFKQKYFGGVKRTLRAFAAVACIVLFVNVSWLGYARTHYGITDGFGVIQQGDCDQVGMLSTWYHLLINILSTLLLTGSKAFMAVYSCPSRQEVDKAHQRGRYLNVGGLSFGNLTGIAKRKGLVLVLAMSSVPFHLLYNSLVFTALATNQYYWSVVTDDFLTGASFNLTGPWRFNDSMPIFTASPLNSSFGDVFELDLAGQLNYETAMDDYWTDMQKNASSWERLENKDCIQQSSNVFISGRRNVLLVSSTKNDTNSVLMYSDADIDGSMDGNCWTVFDYPIEYCLSQPTKDICSVNFSMTTMIVVLSFNALKVVLMVWVLFRFDAEKILTSIGDATASFLTFEDPTTMQMCLADKRNIRTHWQARGFDDILILRRIFLRCMGKDQGIDLTASGLWKLGFGELNQNALVIYGAEAGDNPIVMAIVANIPQIFLLMVYLMYMGIMSSMFLAQDWSRFASQGQTLMVSTPSGKQRGPWLLGAPLT